MAGVVGAVVGAVLWAAITLATNFQIGFMAVGVGVLVGFAVRLGKGIDKVFGYLGAVLALAGCILGDVFTIIGTLSQQRNVNLIEAAQSLDLSKVPGVMIKHSSPIDLLFFGIAIMQGYKCSFRRFSQREAYPG